MRDFRAAVLVRRRLVRLYSLETSYATRDKGKKAIPLPAARSI